MNKKDSFGVEFSNDMTTLISCPKDLKGKNMIINDNAFSKCNKLRAIYVPKGQKSFYSKSGLKDCKKFLALNQK